MASSEIDMCTMGGSDIDGGMRRGTITDVNDMSDMKLPSPGYSPHMVHGLESPGSGVGIKDPWPMSQMR